MNYKASFIIPVLVLLAISPVLAQSLVTPQDFTAFDTPNDAGTSVSLIWKVSENDREGVYYIISTAPTPDGPWTKLDPILSTTGYKSDFPQYFNINESNKLWHFL